MRPLGMIYGWWSFLDRLGLIKGEDRQARLQRMARIAHWEEWFFSFFLLNLAPVAVTLLLLWLSPVGLGWGTIFTWKFWKILWVATVILYILSGSIFSEAHRYILRWEEDSEEAPPVPKIKSIYGGRVLDSGGCI
jgi:hypothetical protein